MQLLHCKLIFSVPAVFPFLPPTIHNNKTTEKKKKNQMDEFLVKLKSMSAAAATAECGYSRCVGASGRYTVLQ